MVNKAIICSCKVSAGFTFVSITAVILFTLLSSNITSKNLFLDLYLVSHLIIGCSDGLHFPITIAYIFFYFFFHDFLSVKVFLQFYLPCFLFGGFSLCIMLSIQTCVFLENHGRVLQISCYAPNVFCFWSSSRYNYGFFHGTCPMWLFFPVFTRVDIIFSLSLGYHQQIMLLYIYDDCCNIFSYRSVSYELLPGLSLLPW